MRPEAALTKRIRVALAKDGRARLVVNFVGLVVPYMQKDAQPVHAGLGKGSADLVGILKGGRAMALEVKTPTGAVRPEQVTWMQAFRAWGGFACVVRSEADAVAAVERAIRGESQ